MSILQNRKYLMLFSICCLLNFCAPQQYANIDKTSKTVLVGANLQLNQGDITGTDFNGNTTVQHSLYSKQYTFPFQNQFQQIQLENFLSQTLKKGAYPMITFVTEQNVNFSNLDFDIWSTDVSWIVDTLLDYKNYTIFINFLPDANGHWYPWGQNPFKFIKAYQIFAIAVKEQLPNVQMVWTVAQDDGYPAFGNSTLNPSLNDSQIQPYLDSNYDGIIDGKDDPFNPYYPGGFKDALVDWIGINYEFSGVDKVTGQSHLNIVANNGTFSAGFQRFYQLACRRRQKPVMITGTSSFFNQSLIGINATNFDIKTGWMNQVYNLSMISSFPLVKAIQWYEQFDIPTSSSYNITGDRKILDYYSKLLSDPIWTKARNFVLTDKLNKFATLNISNYNASQNAAAWSISKNTIILQVLFSLSVVFIFKDV